MITKETEILWALGFGPSASVHGDQVLEVRVCRSVIEEPKRELTASDGMEAQLAR
jgi:hypothetical protein